MTENYRCMRLFALQHELCSAIFAMPFMAILPKDLTSGPGPSGSGPFFVPDPKLLREGHGRALIALMGLCSAT
jgi:hypothetical protein